MKFLIYFLCVAFVTHVYSLECKDDEKLMTNCPRMSEPTCTHFNGTLRLLDCFKPECYCKDSTFRDPYDGKCYILRDCPDYSFLVKLMILLKSGKGLDGLFF